MGSSDEEEIIVEHFSFPGLDSDKVAKSTVKKPKERIVNLGMPAREYLEFLMQKIDIEMKKGTKVKEIKETGPNLDTIYVEDRTMDPDFTEFAR